MSYVKIYNKHAFDECGGWEVVGEDGIVAVLQTETMANMFLVFLNKYCPYEDVCKQTGKCQHPLKKE